MQKYDNYFNENHSFVGGKQAMSADANSLNTDLNFTVLEKSNFPAHLFAHLMQLQKVQQVIQVFFQEYADFMHILISKSNLHFCQSLPSQINALIFYLVSTFNMNFMIAKAPQNLKTKLYCFQYLPKIGFSFFAN